MQNLAAQGALCITDPAAVGLLRNTNLTYSAWKTCDAEICETGNVSVGKVCNTNAAKLGGWGYFSL
ncbi:unnamed protein product [Amoebophrya sp. A120]|nr:unnamed protein product [Amoebophrya sp. A120]|eukprot:GSA120T00025481001.1